VGWLAGAIGTRRRQWALLGVWLLLIVGFAPIGLHLQDVVNDDYAVPASSQTGQVHTLLRERFATGDQRPLILVYRQPGGFSAADKRQILADARKATQFPHVGRPIAPFTSRSPDGLVSRDGTVAVTVVPLVAGKILRIRATLDDLRGLAGTHPALEMHVTGFSALVGDVNSAIKEADVKLLGATVALVLVLLLAVYRSPLLAFVPLLVVGLAYSVTSGLVYGLNKALGLPVDSTSSSLLLVLMFGAGTDYCLLLVARYRSALKRNERAVDAMKEALPQAAPAMVASGVTVMSALVVMLAGAFGVNRTLGPVNAIGVGMVLLASLTLLPALLCLLGRRAFWPNGAAVAYAPGPPARAGRGRWYRIGSTVRAHPGRWLGFGLVVLAAFAVGLATLRSDMSPIDQFRKSTDATRGYEVLRSSFPPGALAPTTVLVQRGGGRVTAGDLRALERRLLAVPGVAAVQDLGSRSRDGQIAQLTAVFADDPFRNPALDRVDQLRGLFPADGRPLGVLFGGGSAERVDYRSGANRDAKVVAPLVLAVVFVTLLLLLRAIVAPVYLLLTVVLSFIGSLGASLLVFRFLFDQHGGVDPLIPLIIFIFLVALGSDYNIFLMSRAREEADRLGTSAGMLRAVAATGPVITSAGIILAGTFGILIVLPVWPLAEIGFAVSIGVLIDTFLVRSICVPAGVWLLGDRVWWPARVGGEGVEPSSELATGEATP
jgi:RND superfamily putative drug exporter